MMIFSIIEAAVGSLDSLTEISDAVVGKDWLRQAMIWGIKLVIGLILIWIGMRISRGISRLSARAMTKAEVEPTVVQFLRKVVYVALLVMLFVGALQIFGVPATSILTLVGAAGLAIGLALKDSLSNIASGVMLVSLRTLKVGDVVNIADKTGKVESISIFQTILRGPNNQIFVIPNNLVTSSPIINLTPGRTRRIELTIGIGYSDDIDLARATALEIMHGDERVHKDPAPDVLVYALAESSVNLGIRCHVNNEDYLACNSALQENIKKAFDRVGVSIPFPQRQVHVIQARPD